MNKNIFHIGEHIIVNGFFSGFEFINEKGVVRELSDEDFSLYGIEFENQILNILHNYSGQCSEDDEYYIPSKLISSDPDFCCTQNQDNLYDYKKSIQELKDMLMYLDENKNTSDIISLQSEVLKQFGNILEQRIEIEKEKVNI